MIDEFDRLWNTILNEMPPGSRGFAGGLRYFFRKFYEAGKNASIKNKDGEIEIFNDNDYLIKNKGQYWITVKDFSILISVRELSEVISIYKVGKEMEDPIEEFILEELIGEQDD
jgi:hypothetical protein